MKKPILALSATLAAVASVASSSAMAQAFPSKPITVVIAVAASSNYAIALRQMADQIQAKNSNPIIFDYVNGAAGTIAATRVKRAEPDGYTIGLTYASVMTLSPLMMKDVQYDPLKDFSFITMLTRHGLLFIARPDFGPGNVQELIAAAKAKPDGIKFGYASNATHVSLLQFEAATGTKFYHVPYKTAAQSDAAGMSGEVDFVGSTVGNLIGPIKQGRLKPVFIGSKTRAPAAPQVQSIAEVYPNMEFVSWFALHGPAGMPADRVNWHNREWNGALKEPKMANQVENVMAFEVVASPPQVLFDQVKRELTANAVTVKQHNITE